MSLTSLQLDHISSHLSLCIGILTTLRGIPLRLKHNELPLPLDLCLNHNLVQESVFRMGPEAPGLRDVVLEVATRARDHLNTAGGYIDDLRVKDRDLLNAAFPAFLTAVSSPLSCVCVL